MQLVKFILLSLELLRQLRDFCGHGRRVAIDSTVLVELLLDLRELSPDFSLDLGDVAPSGERLLERRDAFLGGADGQNCQ